MTLEEDEEMAQDLSLTAAPSHLSAPLPPLSSPNLHDQNARLKQDDDHGFQIDMYRDVDRDGAEWDFLTHKGLQNVNLDLLEDENDNHLPLAIPLVSQVDNEWQLEDDDLVGEDLQEELVEESSCVFAS